MFQQVAKDIDVKGNKQGENNSNEGNKTKQK